MSTWWFGTGSGKSPSIGGAKTNPYERAPARLTGKSSFAPSISVGAFGSA